MESDFPNKISENISIFQEKCLIVNIIQYKFFTINSILVIQINSDQFLINKQESAGLKHLNDFKVFVVDSNEIGDTYNNIEEQI